MRKAGPFRPDADGLGEGELWPFAIVADPVGPELVVRALFQGHKFRQRIYRPPLKGFSITILRLGAGWTSPTMRLGACVSASCPPPHRQRKCRPIGARQAGWEQRGGGGERESESNFR